MLDYVAAATLDDDPPQDDEIQKRSQKAFHSLVAAQRVGLPYVSGIAVIIRNVDGKARPYGAP